MTERELWLIACVALAAMLAVVVWPNTNSKGN